MRLYEFIIHNVQILLCFFICFSLCLNLRSNTDRILYQTESAEFERIFPTNDETQSDGIPERLLIQMRDVFNASEFLKHFVISENNFEIPFDDDIGIGARRALAAAAAVGEIAQFATCRPELQVVKLAKPEDESLMLWPPCVRLRRCGGCCTSKLLTCQPVLTSNVNITVLKVRYSPQLPDVFQGEGVLVMTVEQHDRCACRCKQREDQCVPGVQEYRAAECRCICLDRYRALQCTGPDRVWDSSDCSCKCRSATECSTGFYFNFRNCRCEVFRGALIAAFAPEMSAQSTSLIGMQALSSSTVQSKK